MKYANRPDNNSPFRFKIISVIEFQVLLFINFSFAALRVVSYLGLPSLPALMFLRRSFDHGTTIIRIGKMNKSLVGGWLMFLVHYVRNPLT